MEIKLPLPAHALTPVKDKLDALPLHLQQQLTVKVIETHNEHNLLNVQFANKTIQLQSEQPLSLKTGQELLLEVVKLQPQAVFKMLQSSQQAGPGNSKNDLTGIALTQPKHTPAPEAPSPTAKLPVTGQQVSFRIVEVNRNGLSGLFVSEIGDKADLQRQTIATTVSWQQIVNLTTAKLSSDDRAVTLAKGQWLLLEVINDAEPPQFKLVVPPHAAANERLIAETVKQNLPIQESATKLLNSLTGLENKADVPQLLKRLAREILQGLPQRSQLTEPEGLRQQIDNSGRLLEAKLMQFGKNPAIDLQDDFKLKVLRLIGQLPSESEVKADGKLQENGLNLVKEILQQSRSTLARIVLDQLASLPKEEGNKLTWLVELPFFDRQRVDTVALQIEREKSSTSNGIKKNWSVTMTLSPPGLGTIHCKLHSYDNIVSTRFWSDCATTVSKINQHLASLKQQLEAEGIKPGLIEVQQGRPQRTTTPPLSGQNLLNEKV